MSSIWVTFSYIFRGKAIIVIQHGSSKNSSEPCREAKVKNGNTSDGPNLKSVIIPAERDTAITVN